MTLINNFCCCKKNPRRELDKQRNPRSITIKRDGPPIVGRERDPFQCKEPCNKLGLFAERDWVFDRIFRDLPESNKACRCVNAVRFDQPFIQQGRSCQCLIRPKKVRGQRPQSCGCNNQLPGKTLNAIRCCKVPERIKQTPFLNAKAHRIINRRCLCH